MNESGTTDRWETQGGNATRYHFLYIHRLLFVAQLVGRNNVNRARTARDSPILSYVEKASLRASAAAFTSGRRRFYATTNELVKVRSWTNEISKLALAASRRDTRRPA